MSTTFAKRLDAHFAACAAASAGAAVIGCGERADAAIVYSGVVNITIPNTFEGVYLDMVTGQSSNTFLDGMDLNPYYGGTAMWMGDDGFNRAVGVDSDISNLAEGTLIGPASPFLNFTFPQMGQFTPGQPGIMGLHFNRESDNMILYGWVRLVVGLDTAGTIVDYAYEDAGGSIAAGATGVPAPGALALLALGALRPGQRKRH